MRCWRPCARPKQDGRPAAWLPTWPRQTGARRLSRAEPATDILVNNLGIYAGKEYAEITDADWEEIFQVNVMSGVRLSRHYAKGMQARGWGRIQFISSESALNIPAEMVHYGVSKAALQGVSRGLAKVLAGSGVTVNTILPGPTRTDGRRGDDGRSGRQARDRRGRDGSASSWLKTAPRP